MSYLLILFSRFGVSPVFVSGLVLLAASTVLFSLLSLTQDVTMFLASAYVLRLAEGVAGAILWPAMLAPILRRCQLLLLPCLILHLKKFSSKLWAGVLSDGRHIWCGLHPRSSAGGFPLPGGWLYYTLPCLWSSYMCKQLVDIDRCLNFLKD